MLEICPGCIDDYFENWNLLIDEADSILIDEIANGTIVSKSISLVFQWFSKEKEKHIY